MRLLHLEITGFKSFPDPVTLGFSGGITAIVGPNGCGKSNLAEAMTWVLGERSAKSLRGGKMEDVIFNGSQQRRPVGSAEATVTLLADPSMAEGEDGRVTLSRRVFRTGESQYRMNGKVVRLKQIRDFLMDTGLGIRAYSVIEQGKIGMILSGKPQERRKLLEEAAGITRYKERKRIAEVKLEETWANLLRLDDVISEVERSLRSLKRQAGAARRYKRLQGQFRDLQRRVLAGRWSALHGELGSLEERLAAGHDREAELAAVLSRDEAALAAGRETLDELAAELAERHRHQSDLAATIEGRQEFVKGSRRTLEEISERAAQGRLMAERRQDDSGRFQAALEELAKLRDELVAGLESASAEVSRDEEEIAAAEAELRRAQARVEELRRELLTRADEINRLRRRHQEAEIELQRGSVRRGHLDEEAEGHRRELEEAREAAAAAATTVGGLEDRHGEAAEKQRQAAAALEAAVRREAEAAEELRRLEDELAEGRRRRRLLRELAEAHAERRARLEHALAAAGLAEPDFLADRLEVVAGWEHSLDAYLADLGGAVVLPAGADGLELAGSLGPGSPGALLLRPFDEPPEALPRVDDPAVVLSLGEALGLSEGLAAALPPAFLVEERRDAERLARLHPGVAFLSRDGLWAEGGALHLESGEAAPGVLEQGRELAELDEALPRLETAAELARRGLTEAVERRAGLARDQNRLEEEVAHLRQELAVARARQEDAQGRLRRLEEEGETLAGERAEAEQAVARSAESRGTLAESLAAAEASHTALQESFDEARRQVEIAQAERESLRTASAGRRGRLELLRERLASQDRESERLEAEIEERRRQGRAWGEESERLEQRRRELEEAVARAEEELQAALESRDEAQERVLAAQERLDAHRAEIRALEQRVASTRERRDEARSAVEELRVERAGLEHDRTHLAETYREHFDADLPASGVWPEGEAPEPLEDLREAEGELTRLKAALERLGPVNVLAVEELEEQEERSGFLTEQRADVAQSVDSLKATIREINQTSGERFVTTLAEVNRSFGETFTRLFRGGEAEMRLLDEDDVLESGIEIVARPPGKRLQNIMLLSGGEKALTAIALLFALFRTKPSPFCILDEVDAPLDDVNTVRFVEMLAEMSAETQFIVITHNKLTMEAAGTLYGVTMEEKGVSKLVAVEVDDVQPPQPLAATAA